MDAVFSAAVIYGFLLIIFRIAGERTLASLTNFDLLLLLLIAEAAQQGLVGEDFSITKAVLVITTLVGLDIGISLVKERSRLLQKLLEGVPVVLVENGHVLSDRMRQARVDEQDVLQAARESQGLESLDQIKYAVLERTGQISIIPRESS